MDSTPTRRARSTRPAASRRGALERRALLSARELVDRMRTLYRELERLMDAPIAMHRALTCIGEHPGLPASELATRLGMQRPAVSHVLKALVTRRWIERRRDAGDQRSIHIHPTAEGLQILRATGGRAVGTLQRAVRGLSTRELRQLASGLASLLARLPEPRQPQIPARASAVRRTVLPSRRPALAQRRRTSGAM